MTEIGDEHLARLYSLMGELRDGLRGGRVLGSCTGRMVWPRRGAYFITEPGEVRGGDSSFPRIVRVGTHAVSIGSRSTLWGRLRGHRGNSDGGGNHRGSVFRLHVGMALMARDRDFSSPTWGKGASAPNEIREAESPLEMLVSAYIGRMTVLWVEADDEPGPDSLRAFIEWNAIGLLSGPGALADPPSESWLGRHSHKEAIRSSGLWNVDHIGCSYDPGFLDVLEACVRKTIAPFRNGWSIYQCEH